MITYKIIEVALDIDDPISTYANANTNILRKLQSKYENRCYAGCYIMKVLNIVKQSECVIMQNTESCDGSINVQFRAQVIELLIGEVLHKNLVIKKATEQKLLIGINDICALNIGINDMFASINVGQIIPVVIQKSLYAIGNDRITAYAIPYIPSVTTIAYNFASAQITKEDMATLKDIKSLIADEYELFEELNKTSLDFFTTLLYPYKVKSNKLFNDKKVNVLKLDDIKEGMTLGILARPAEMNSNDKSVYSFNYEDLNVLSDTYKLEIINITNVGKGLNAIWLDYYQRINMMRGFVQTYDKTSDKDAHVNLWKIYNNNKK